MSIWKQNELRKFADDFILHPYRLKKTSFEEKYFHRKGRHYISITVHFDYYEVEVGYYWDIKLTLAPPFTYDSRMDSWSENRGIKLPLNYYPLLLEKIRNQMQPFMPKKVPNEGWGLLSEHLNEQLKEKNGQKEKKADVQLKTMKATLIEDIKALEGHLEASLKGKFNTIETEHYLEKLLKDSQHLLDLLDSAHHIDEARLRKLIEEGIQVIQTKYQEVTESVGKLEENAIRRTLYLIQER